MANNPIICALDTNSVEIATALAVDLKDTVGAVKLGLEFFSANGAQGVKQITNLDIPVFLDLKFHDIPNTVAGAVRSAVTLDIFMLTVHTSGGAEMLKAAVSAAEEESDRLGVKKPMIIGVTVLTSLDDSDLRDVGISRNVEDQVLKLAELANNCNLDGIVCSPLEVNSIKSTFNDSLKLVVPGIKTEDTDNNDQKRTMTPNKALSMGADYIVIGRALTNHKNPKEQATNILSTCA